MLIGDKIMHNIDISSISAGTLEKIVAETVVKSFSHLITKAKLKTKDVKEKISVEIDSAFKTYLVRAYNKHSMIKTIVYRDMPMPLYCFYEHVNLYSRTLNEELSSQSIANLFQSTKTTQPPPPEGGGLRSG